MYSKICVFKSSALSELSLKVILKSKQGFLGIFGNRPDKTKRCVILKSLKGGGLRMVHFEHFMDALKLS